MHYSQQAYGIFIWNYNMTSMLIISDLINELKVVTDNCHKWKALSFLLSSVYKLLVSR